MDEVDMIINNLLIGDDLYVDNGLSADEINVGMYCDEDGDNCFEAYEVVDVINGIEVEEALVEWNYFEESNIGYTSPSINGDSASIVILPADVNPGDDFPGDLSMIVGEGMVIYDYLLVEGDTILQGDVYAEELSGEGYAFACLDNEGQLFRSEVSCDELN